MRIASVLLALFAGSSANLHRSANNITGVVAESPQCRNDFDYYKGWCIYTYGYPGPYYTEVERCADVGAHGPSLHSDEGLKFWSDAVVDLKYDYFWLDAYCPDRGNEPVIWLDGTPTDYYGPDDELAKCVYGSGFILNSFGIHPSEYKYYSYTLCVYRPEVPSTSTSSLLTTQRPITPRPTTVYPSSNETDSCPCTPGTVYLDLVFVVDASDEMTRATVEDATATIQSTLYGLTLGSGKFQTNVAALAYAETVQTITNFGDINSPKDISSLSIPFLGGNSTALADAIKQASSMISQKGRNFARGVIVIFSNSFNGLEAKNIDVVNDFKDNRGVIITVDYSKNSLPSEIASPGYNINSSSEVSGDLLYAFCDANCFCKNGFSPYNTENERGREVPDSCYHVADSFAVYDAAETNCEKKNGFVATVHDDDKNFFLTSLFPPKSRFWLGLERNDEGKFEWADGSTDGYTNWAPENPIEGLDCVFGQQQTGFTAPWFSAPCTDPLKNSMTYACQIRPCSSEYHCWA